MKNVQLAYENNLSDFDLEERRSALRGLKKLCDSGQVPLVPELPIVNLHCHTFFSFNAYGYSPSAYAWEAYKRGLYAAGIIDFDVLDGVNEFLEACTLLGLRSSAGIESRVSIEEWDDREINSPKEPGIAYFMGFGFPGLSHDDEGAKKILLNMSLLTRKRNKVMLEKINDYLDILRVDYDEEVLPLTPSGNATERHMLVAIEEKSKNLFPENKKRAHFWADVLAVDGQYVNALIKRPIELQMLIRSKLMKYGGPGYSTPDKENFPTLEDAVCMIRGFGALPSAGWLDGTSEGERDTQGFLDFMEEKGAVCLGIVPDRNWNIEDEKEKKMKVKKLNEVVYEAKKRDMPVVIGTEMNKQGQKFVDDFTADEMQPLADEFLKGARIIHGHTMATRYLGIGLLSKETSERFKDNKEARNSCFEEIGMLKPVADNDGQKKLSEKIQAIWEKRI